MTEDMAANDEHGSRNRFTMVALTLLLIMVVVVVAMRTPTATTTVLSHESNSQPVNELPKEVRQVFDEATLVEISWPSADYPSNVDDFHSWRGRNPVVIQRLSDCEALRTIIYSGIAKDRTEVLPCFEAVLSIRAEARGKSAGLVLNGCGSIVVYMNERRIGSVGTSTDEFPLIYAILRNTPRQQQIDP